MGLLDRTQKQAVTYLFGVPRWLYGRAARGFVGWTKARLLKRQDPDKVFSDELAVWDLAGFFYGRHFYQPSPVKTAGTASPVAAKERTEEIRSAY
jgi:hypothetical protein